jgi:hypothetical protein
LGLYAVLRITVSLTQPRGTVLLVFNIYVLYTRRERYHHGRTFALNITQKLTKYDKDSKFEFLHDYFKLGESPEIDRSIEMFSTLRAWAKGTRQPHKDFAHMVLGELYTRQEPPWNRYH